MRILWVSDSPASPSGFGAVTRAVCSGLADAGHRIEILGWQTRVPTRWHGIPVRAVRRDQFGADVLLGYMMRLQPDVVVTLADIWWMSFMADAPVQDYLDRAQARWLLYYPVDGAAADGRLPASWVKVLEACDLPVAMSRFGLDVSRACGIDAHYIPHGVDTAMFRPGERATAKRALGYDGRFVVLSDARNQPRKLLPRVLDAARRLCERRPDVIVHLHTDPDDPAAESPLYHYDLREDVKLSGLVDAVRFTAGFSMRPGRGLEMESLATLYRAADAHLLGSYGEGFGLPSLQAASAGVVPLAGAHSASYELVHPHGVALPSETVFEDEFGLVRHLFDREAAADALVALHDDPDLTARRAAAARAYALSYDWANVAGQWQELLTGAPPRRRRGRALTFNWDRATARADRELPDPVRRAAALASSRLPEGASVSFELTERRSGELAAGIHAEMARGHGEVMSIPVRLGPGFQGAPRAPVGRLLCSPADVGLAARLARVFPGLTVSVPKPPDDPLGAEILPLPELLPTLVHYALVVDYAGEAPAGTDLACACLGVPYAGSSAFWPDLPGPPLHQLRALLTDPGLSEWRRAAALARVQELSGEGDVAALREAVLARQPSPAERSPSPPPASGVELVLVRTTDEAAADALALDLRARDWPILLRLANGGMIVAVPQDGRETLDAHPLTTFVGGVTIDEDAEDVDVLKRAFAHTMALERDGRQAALAGAGQPIAQAGREEAP